MKITISLLTLAAALFTQLSFAKVGIPIPYGSEEKTIQMIELPDTEDFKYDDGRYFDIGSFYTKDHIVWLAYNTNEPEIVGYFEGSDDYLEISSEQLEEICKLANIEVPTEGEISFMDKIGGKVILGILVLIIAYGIFKNATGKEEDEEGEVAA